MELRVGQSDCRSVVAHRIVWRFTLMISEKRIARNDIDEVKYVD